MSIQGDLVMKKEKQSIELDEEIRQLVEIHNRVYGWRQDVYDNPTVQPAYDRLSKALIHLSKAIDIMLEPMG
jgi:hypothetical protein